MLVFLALNDYKMEYTQKELSDLALDVAADRKQYEDIFESKMNFPQNKNWGMRLKNRWLRTVKNHCKASKMHSSGNLRPGRKKGKFTNQMNA